MDRSNKYLGLKRLLALLAAIGLWGVSMFFSYKGFEFEATEVLWFGVVMALVVTVVELVFNTQITSLNPTLIGAGILCYLYGVYTNVTGFYILQHGDLAGFFSGSNWLIPSFAGLVSEILPEALFAWGIGAFDDGDLVGNVAEILASDKSTPRKSTTYVPGGIKNISQQKKVTYPPGNNNVDRFSGREKHAPQKSKFRMVETHDEIIPDMLPRNGN